MPLTPGRLAPRADLQSFAYRDVSIDTATSARRESEVNDRTPLSSITPILASDLTIRLSGKRVRCLQSKLLNLDHRLPPYLSEDDPASSARTDC